MKGNSQRTALEKRKIRKKYYRETRGDVLLRNKEVFRYWKHLGLEYMFLGLEAIDEEGLKLFRKRVTLSKSFEALEFARSLGIRVAVNIIADPDWDEKRFALIRDWALSVPEIVNVSVNTPYPGTESFLTESRNFSTRDYRLFDIQHAVATAKANAWNTLMRAIGKRVSRRRGCSAPDRGVGAACVSGVRVPCRRAKDRLQTPQRRRRLSESRPGGVRFI